MTHAGVDSGGTFPSLGETPSLLMVVDGVDELGHPDFVEAYTETCALCSSTLLQPYQTRCGHRLCKVCLTSHLNHHGDPALCPYAEEDCEHISLKDGSVYPDFFLLKSLKSRKVFCKYKHLGCPETVPWGRLKEHVATCEYGRVPCPHADLGCTEKLLPPQLDDHVTRCPYTPTSCPHCGLTGVATCLMETHLQECPMVRVQCTYGCGVTLLRQEVSSHQKSCLKKPVECKFRRMGCTFQGSTWEVQQHESLETVRHLQLVTGHCEQLESRMRSLEQQQQEGLRSQQTCSHRADEVLRNHTHKLTQQQTLLKATQKRVIEQDEKIRNTQELVGQQGSGDVGALQDQVRGTNTRLTTLETAHTGGMVAIRTLEEKHKDQTQMISDFNLRFQILETASYDGTLLWKIKDYKLRKAEAQRPVGVQSLYSQAFYTSRHGYRMCARVYLNGDGMGANSHLSLFFVVMRGEYDPLLRWPYRQKVSLMMMDQTGSGRHVQDTFRPDPSSSSFQLPHTNMNIASGCPLFISHDVLEAKNSPYLKDDTIFIKVAVDTADLPKI